MAGSTRPKKGYDSHAGGFSSGAGQSPTHPRSHAPTRPPDLPLALIVNDIMADANTLVYAWVMLRYGCSASTLKRWSRELVAAIKAARCNEGLRSAAVGDYVRICRLMPSLPPLTPLLGVVAVVLPR